MELRLALAACLVLGSGLCGRAMADGVRRRARTLEGLSAGVRTLRIHMTGLLEPVQNALRRADCPILSLVAEAMEGGVSAKEAWHRVEKRATRRGGAIDALDEGDRRLLEHLFCQLGQSGREEQEALLSAVQSAIDERRLQAAEKVREADRLYLTLGLLTGIMLALIVI